MIVVAALWRGVSWGCGVVRAARVSTHKRQGTSGGVSAHVLYTFGMALTLRAWQSFLGESEVYSVSPQLHRFAPKVAGVCDLRGCAHEGYEVSF